MIPVNTELTAVGSGVVSLVGGILSIRPCPEQALAREIPRTAAVSGDTNDCLIVSNQYVCVLGQRFTS